ncbi:PAS domain-containing protein [Azovibrio restrictus]|uniref:PAS domain-containing sensor histidine kinase n=1 Tax=Azovibrio restrictus TaxID=146938 RepID=UPI0026EDFAC8|nr:PAS domain-containing protein [Azovibrio restrictus]MDD3483298.1 PAS domain-containing protein [Azovibrio restrictus]
MKAASDLSAQLRALLQGCAGPAYVLDQEGRCLLANGRMLEIYGLQAGEMEGRRREEFMPADLARVHRDNDLRVTRAAQPVDMEETLWTRCGQRRLFRSRKIPLRDQEERIFAVATLCADITGEQQALEAVRRLSQELLQVQETERAALSRELHDELGQGLTALKFKLASLRRQVPGSGEASLGQAMEMVDALVDQVRGLARRLHPAVLDDLGLAAAVRWLLGGYQDEAGQGGLQVSLTENLGDERLSPELELACFRVIQESLCNIRRHAVASHGVVLLFRNAERLHLVIEDDGHGFDLDDFRRDGPGFPGGLGLRGIRERVAALGGELGLRSTPGLGTQVRVVFPAGATRT